MSDKKHDEAGSESTIDWLNRLLGGQIGGPRPDSGQSARQYLLRPNATEPQLLLPLGKRNVSASALRRFHDSRSTTSALVSTTSPILGHPALLRHTGGEPIQTAPFKLVDDLARTLGEPELHASVILGPRRRNRKPVLQLIRPDGVVVGFAKVGWSPLTREIVSNERDVLRRLNNRLPASIEAPVVLHDEQDHERLVVVTSAVSNGPLPRRNGPLSLDFVLKLARSVSGGEPAIGDLPYLDSWRKAELVAPLLERLIEKHGGETTCEVGLWHGDLTPWNTSTTKRKTVIWDWEFAGFDRPLGFDLLHDIFERNRRNANTTTTTALNAVLSEGAARLSTFTGAGEAIIDLYLCELLHRESELEGQRWESETVQPATKALLEALAHRLDYVA